MLSVISCLTVDVASFCAAVGVAADADDAIRVNVIAAAEKIVTFLHNSYTHMVCFETLYLSCYVHLYTKGAWLSNNKNILL